MSTSNVANGTKQSYVENIGTLGIIELLKAKSSTTPIVRVLFNFNKLSRCSYLSVLEQKAAYISARNFKNRVRGSLPDMSKIGHNYVTFLITCTQNLCIKN